MREAIQRAVFVGILVTAAIAGCNRNPSPNPPVTIGGPSGDLGNPDNVPNASSIAQNNLADDTGAFSNNGQNLIDLKVVYNSPAAVGTTTTTSTSTGPSDDTAIVLFTTHDPTGNGRLYASHFELGSQDFTPPVEISGDERDEKKDETDIDLQAAVMVPLNVSSYSDASGKTVQSVARNSGDWVILWSATTRRLDPAAVTTANPAELAVPPEGPRRTIYYTLFIHSLRNTSRKISDALGKPNAQTTVGTAREYSYGFLVRGVDVIKRENGSFIGGDALLTKAGGRNLHRPAEDVLNFGVVTDTFSGLASFVAGNAIGALRPGPGGAGMADMNTLIVRAKVGTSTAGSLGNGRPAIAAYRPGDATSFLRLFFVQVTSSRTTAGDTYVSHLDETNNVHGGARQRLFSCDFDLDALDFVAAAEVGFPAQRRAPTGASAANSRTQPVPRYLFTYNGHFFWSYIDASLAGDNAAVVNNGGVGFGTDIDQLLGAGVPSMQSMSNIQAITTVTPTSTGTSTIAKTVDLTLLGSNGVHVTANTAGAICPDGPVQANAPSAPVNNIGPLDESSLLGSFLNGATLVTRVFGADEKLGDTSVYFLAQANSVAIGTTVFPVKTEEVQLCCAAIDPKTGNLVAGSPKVISKHEVQTTLGATGNPGLMSNLVQGLTATTGFDSVLDFDCAIPRNGSYVMTVFRQASGSTVNGEIVLNATVEQSFTGAGAAPSLDARFAAAPVQLNAGAAAHPLTRSGDIGAAAFAGAAGFGAGQRPLVLTYPLALDNVLAAIFPFESGTIAGDTKNGRVGNDSLDRHTGTVVYSPGGDFIGDLQGLKAVPVRDFSFQSGLGFVCGFQSDVNKMNVFWSLGDGTEDQLFIAQVPVTLGNGTPTPTLPTTITEHEITGPKSVDAPGVFAKFSATDQSGDVTSLKSSFKFLPESLPISPRFAIDAGPDAAGAGGGVLFYFWRVDDATLNDGNWFNAKTYAVLFDGATVGTPVDVGHPVHEDNQAAFLAAPTGPNTFDPNAVYTFDLGANVFLNRRQLSFTAHPHSADITTNGGSHSPDFVELYVFGTSGDTASSVPALFARKWDATIRRTTATASTPLDQQFTPAAGTSATAGDVPTRLSREHPSGDLSSLDTFQDGAHIAVVFQQDEHLWVAQTDDGTTWSQDKNGKPLPPLLDNNTTSDVVPAISGFAPLLGAHRFDGKCDDFHGSLMFFTKTDIGTPGTTRLFVRSWNR
jgi:hypothetical protein